MINVVADGSNDTDDNAMTTFFSRISGMSPSTRLIMVQTTQTQPIATSDALPVSGATGHFVDPE